MYDLIKVDKENINEMINSYYKNVTAPMDDMWESGIIGKGDYFTIKKKEDVLGYFVVDNDNNLLQFFLKDECLNESSNIFELIKTSKEIKQAFVSTSEPRYLSLCLDNNDGVEINSYLYTEMEAIEFKKPLESISSQLANVEDLDRVLVYNNEMGFKGDWLIKYCKDLICNHGLILYKIEDKIIGTGEMRPSFSSKSYANLGVTVSEIYRRMNIGTYILSNMRLLANKQGLKAICSTDKDNIASQHTIEKSGFYPYHRVLTVKLR